MAAEVLRMLDPELLIPSDASAASLRFWQRLDERVEDKAPRVGPATMRALQVVMSDLPQVAGLPSGDMWAILGKIVNRGFAARDPQRLLCADHFSSMYEPVLGSGANKQILMADAAAAGANTVIALSTVEECWSALPECLACHARRLHLLTEPLPAPQDMAEAWRDSVLSEFPDDISALEVHAAEVFPNLTFADRAWGDTNKLQGDARDIYDALFTHLRVLNDHVGEIWRTFTESIERQSALGSYGVSGSPESPKTRRDAAAMKERDFAFGGRTIRCEWHTKMRPTVNRVHFAVGADEIFIGTITDHLAV